MARPTKQGIDFFSLDCEPEAKLELFIAENGAEGFGILVMLWQMIYKGDGYYIHYDEDLVWLIRKESLSQAETIVSVIENAIKRNLFDNLNNSSEQQKKGGLDDLSYYIVGA